VDIIDELKTYHAQVDVHDPWVDADEARTEYGIELLTDAPQADTYDAVILAVPHREFVTVGTDLRTYGTPECVLFDVKSALPATTADLRL
jgi:UDP-N-acetyl-D-galactosamine dehydrogenase